MSDAAAPPPFDPSKPFTTVGAGAPPPFDPSKPFERGGSGLPPPAPHEGETSTLSALWEGLQHGLGNIAMGVGRLGAKAGLGYPGMSEDTDKLAQFREKQFEQQPTTRQHPTATAVGEVGGEMLGAAPAGLARAGAAATRPVQMLWDALTGAGGGAVTAAANAPADRFGSMVATGAGLGVGLGTAAGQVGRIAARPLAGPVAPAAAARLRDFQGKGVTPSVPVIGQGPMANRAAQAARVLPFSPVGRRVDQNIAETAVAAERAATGFGPATPDQGGTIAANALRGYAGDTTASEKMYADFWTHMSGAPNAPVTRTVSALDKIRGRFPNAPELKDIWPGSTQLGTMQRALTPRTETIPAKMSGMLDPYGRPIVVSPAQTVKRGGELSIPELKELKTKVGSLLETAAPPGETSIPRGQVKQLYAAIRGDLMDAAAKQGPAAVKALVKADSSFALRMSVLDRLEPLLTKNSPESVWSAINQAAGASRGDVGLLRTAKRVMKPDDWSNVGAAMIRRLGEMPPGTPRVQGQPEFSVAGFANNWRKLSDKAKDVLFGDDTYGSPRAGLEQLYRVASDIQKASHLGSASHTYNLIATGTAINGILTSIMMGHIPLAEMGGMGGSYGLSKALMSPRIAKMLYEMPKFFKPGSTAADMRDAALASIAPTTGEETGRQIGERGPYGGRILRQSSVPLPQ